jgi:hypothetical protein
VIAVSGPHPETVGRIQVEPRAAANNNADPCFLFIKQGRSKLSSANVFFECRDVDDASKMLALFREEFGGPRNGKLLRRLLLVDDLGRCSIEMLFAD